VRFFGSLLMGCAAVPSIVPDGNGSSMRYNPKTVNTAGYNKNTGDRAVNIDNSQRVETNQNGVMT